MDFQEWLALQPRDTEKTIGITDKHGSPNLIERQSMTGIVAAVAEVHDDLASGAVGIIERAVRVVTQGDKLNIRANGAHSAGDNLAVGLERDCGGRIER